MLDALVQNDFDLTVQHILNRMRTVNSASSVATLRAPGTVTTATYEVVADNADRLAAALAKLGIGSGDRIATMCWNTQEHFEMYFAIPCMGAVLHTLNLRLFDDQLIYVINHAGDRVIIVDDTLAPTLARIAGELKNVEHFIVVGPHDHGGLPRVLRYHELLEAEEPGFAYPHLSDRSAASLCYTTGTTGTPRGVLYGHRSTVLHAMAQGLGATFDIRGGDRVLPVVPMFHANAWGLPYACALLGADLVMPSRFLEGKHLLPLIRDEAVTAAAGVPAVLISLAARAADEPEALKSVRKIWSGGSAVPRALMERYDDEFGVAVVQGFGMTETSPLVAIAEPPPEMTGEQRWHYRTKSGRFSPLVEARLVDAEGNELPWDGVTSGELQFRGPWIASGYYENPEATSDRFIDGWLKTGDIATIDKLGYLQITDRVKDVIKSGGEWISSVELENALMGYPGIIEAAVIARPDERWSERPLACVVVSPLANVAPEDLDAYLGPLVARWWLPDAYVFLDEVPKTSVGKFDKKELRHRLSEGRIGTVIPVIRNVHSTPRDTET